MGDGKCGQKCEVYSRVCGFYSQVKQWNGGKKEEFRLRKTFKLNQGGQKDEKNIDKDVVEVGLSMEQFLSKNRTLIFEV